MAENHPNELESSLKSFIGSKLQPTPLFYLKFHFVPICVSLYFVWSQNGHKKIFKIFLSYPEFQEYPRGNGKYDNCLMELE